ncbi:MAG: PRC-barrel domain-containing protein [Aquamicrobium sp.]|uniref:PRC-barrel domain-containing protein n=1 Tax=Aquamicrobium sp. TaxID=1872579 RepID=UPI00349EB9DB|nr:PRC-barrel domain-containing protein [Aquamicrobium sp.]
MLHRKLLLAMALGGLMTGGAAMAQAALVEVNSNVHVAAFGAIADQVDDWDVYDASGTEIGEVDEVVGSDAGTPTALVIDFDGKAGYADRDVVIPIDQFTRENNRLTLNASPDAVGAMETWNG